jgi:hypothetical protein
MLYADPTGIRNESRNWSFVRFHTSILDGDMESPQRQRSSPFQSFSCPHPTPHLCCQIEICVLGTHAVVPSIRARDYRSCPGSHAVGTRRAFRQRLTKLRLFVNGLTGRATGQVTPRA